MGWIESIKIQKLKFQFPVPQNVTVFEERAFKEVVVAVQSLSHVWLFVTPWTAAHQVSCPSLSPGVCPNSCPLNQWCHPIISSSVIPFSSRFWYFPASGSFPRSWFFVLGGQSIRASASALVFPMNIQGWFPLGLTGLISLLSKGLSRVFSSTTI